MNCKNHPDKESTEKCGFCNQELCTDCLIELEGKYFCKNCLAEKSGLTLNCVERGPEAAEPKIYEKKSKLLAFLFSTVPGVGYLYLGMMTRGLHTMVLFFGSIFVASFIGFEEIMALVAPVVIFYSIFDTQQLVKNINYGIPVEDKELFNIKKIPFNQSWVGYTLIFIGLMALLQNTLPYDYALFHTVKRLIPPLMIIGAGVLIIYRSTRKQ